MGFLENIVNKFELKVGDKYIVTDTNTLFVHNMNNGLNCMDEVFKLGDIIEIVKIENLGMLVGVTSFKINGGEVLDIESTSDVCWCLFTETMVNGIELYEEPEQLPHETKSTKFDDIVTKPLEERYNEWVIQNMKFYELFSKFALEAVAAGRTKISHWLIVNRIRWECAVTGVATCKEDRDFKISNDYIAFMARDFIKDHPEHDGLFTFKKMKGEK